MKKFMWLIVASVVALTGCASPNSRDRNPHTQNALVFGATAAGATYGYRQAGPVGGVVLGTLAMLGMKAVLWEPSTDPEYVVVGGGQVQGQNGSGYVVNLKRSGAKKKERRLTIDNYQTVNEDGLGTVPEDCRTGNWGMDASCLKVYSAKLDKYQAKCIKEGRTKDPICLKRPGVLAGEYAILADDLDKLEKKARGGMTYDRLTGLSK
jgi:hypothetical protein